MLLVIKISTAYLCCNFINEMVASNPACGGQVQVEREAVAIISITISPQAEACGYIVLKFIKGNFMKRTNISSGAKWEDIVGYSRAVKIGSVIEVSGTTAVDGEQIIGEDDVYLQTKFIIQKISKVLEDAGASLKDVVRTRIFITDISRWEEAGKAHGEFFKDIKPAATMVEVKALIDPKLLVEIEATAILS